MNLPDGVSSNEFAAAVDALKKAVGNQWVFTEDRHVDTYRDYYSPLSGAESEGVPSVAVAPSNTQEVQKVVRIANQYGIPFWVNSTGKNYGYGGPAGIVKGTMNIDLKRMNRVLKASEKHAYVLVEPGVSWLDLHAYLKEKDIKLWLDPPAPAWGSVLANAVERGVGYTNYCERVHYICGMEVVLPDGELVRTGMGALPTSGELWQGFPTGQGPYVDGIFTQTNVGIVTKLGLHLQPEPPVYLAGDVIGPDYESMIPLLDVMRPMRHAQIIHNNASLYPFYKDGGIVTISTEDPAKIHRWSNLIGFYGLPGQVDAQWEYVQDVYAREMPGVQFAGRRYEAPHTDLERRIHPLDIQRAGIPKMLPYEHEAYMSIIFPFEGQAAMDVITEFNKVAQKYGRRYGGTLMHAENPHALITTSGMSIRPRDTQFNGITHKILEEWVDVSTENGWGAYRSHVTVMDKAQKAYSFNNHSLNRMNERIKDALDPNGVMAPGKNGIWPKRYREAT